MLIAVCGKPWNLKFEEVPKDFILDLKEEDRGLKHSDFTNNEFSDNNSMIDSNETIVDNSVLLLYYEYNHISEKALIIKVIVVYYNSFFILKHSYNNISQN